MKVDTPQITLHAMESDGKNHPILTVTILESGLDSNNNNNNNNNNNLKKINNTKKFGSMVATGGANTEIHLWRLNNSTSNTSNTSDSSSSTNNILQHKCLLTRMDRSVNAIKFSPNGLYLVAAGDGGNVVVYSVPREKRGGGNGQHYWSEVSKEADLLYRIIPTQMEDIFDIAWSPDSKRFVICSLDHSIAVIQIETEIEIDNNNSNNNNNSSNDGTVAPASSSNTTNSHSHSATTATTLFTHPTNKDEHKNNHPTTIPMSENSKKSKNSKHKNQTEKWSIISRHKDHTHYVQGIAYDPMGVYIASQASDRTVRIMSRKPPPKEKLLLSSSQEEEVKYEVESKQQVIKYYREIDIAANNNNNTVMKEMNKKMNVKNDNTDETNDQQQSKQREKQALKRHLFCDESSLESFYRRLSWTPDGAFLIAPAGLWSRSTAKSSTSTSTTDPSYSYSYSTLIFARHRFEDGPVAVLSGHAKPSIVVRPCPTLFQLPKMNKLNKENPLQQQQMSTKLNHRTIFCVLTTDTVYLYDTVQLSPLAVVRGIHYAGLTDAAWSKDGRSLLVTSSDGYLSVLSFEEGELGDVLEATAANSLCSGDSMNMEQNEEPSSSPVNCNSVSVVLDVDADTADTTTGVVIDHTADIVVEVPPAKRVKMAETPLPPAAVSSSVRLMNDHAPLPVDVDVAFVRNNKRALDDDGNNELADYENLKPEIQTTKEVMKQVNDLSLDKNGNGNGGQAAGPKKKRIRPQLINTTIS